MIDNETLLLAMLDIREQEEDEQKAKAAIGRLIDYTNKSSSREKSIRHLVTKDNQQILAIDMDGTLADTPPHGDGPPPPLSECRPKEDMVKAVQEAAKQGYRIIIFTGRDDEAEIEEWLNKYNVPYESINRREDQPTSSPKVIASAYVDDRAMTPEEFIQNMTENRQIKRLSSIIRKHSNQVMKTSLRFKCPTCLRQTLAVRDASDVATEVRDLKCPACGAKWRFIITPKPLAGGLGMTHSVSNTARLDKIGN